MLKYEAVAQVGEVVKAYDFEPCFGRKEYYVIGIVQGVETSQGVKFLVVKCIKDAGSIDEYSRVGSRVYVACEMSEFSEFEGRVTRV